METAIAGDEAHANKRRNKEHGILDKAIQANTGPNNLQTTGIAEENIIDLVIDSGAAIHVCPPWFAPRFQLHQLPKGEEPQLRTVANTQITAHGYKYAIMRNNKKPSIVIPFYVCDVHAPILSVTRLAEQGFNIQLNETPTMTHRHGFEAQLIQKEGLYFDPVHPEGQLPSTAGRTCQLRKDHRGVHRQAERAVHRRSMAKPEPHATEATTSRQRLER